MSPGWVAQLIGILSHTPTGRGFESLSGQMPRVRVLSPGGVPRCSREVSLTQGPLPCPLSKISGHVLGWKFLKREFQMKISSRLKILVWGQYFCPPNAVTLQGRGFVYPSPTPGDSQQWPETFSVHTTGERGCWLGLVGSDRGPW